MSSTTLLHLIRIILLLVFSHKLLSACIVSYGVLQIYADRLAE